MQRQTQFRSICAYEHLVGSIIHTSWIGDYKHLYSTSIRNHLHSHALCQGLWLERVRETGRKYVMYSPNFLVSNPNHSTHPPLVHHVSHFESSCTGVLVQANTDGLPSYWKKKGGINALMKAWWNSEKPVQAINEKAFGVGRCAAVCVLGAGRTPMLIQEWELSWAKHNSFSTDTSCFILQHLQGSILPF